MKKNKNLIFYKIFFSALLFCLFSYFSLTIPSDYDKDILINLRIPRFLTLIITGFSLSTAGMILQLLTKNPLADPFIIGTSGSSMLAIIISNIIGLKFYGFEYFFLILSFSVSATLISYKISVLSSSQNTSLLLSGIALNSFVLSIIVIFVIFSRDATVNFFHLSFGSFAYNEYRVIGYSFFIISILFIIISVLIEHIKIIAFDEEKAETLGVNTKRLKLIVFIITAALTSVSVSVSGIIGFVGLMIPHITRRLLSNADLKILFLINAVYGAFFLLISDLAVKSLFYPTELPPGVISSIAGSIFFIWLVLKREKRNE
ncbi:MAG: FecCD family ABC transporter permease [Elusimicrobiales bacterium]|nr:iron ABC transporter permease [Elusimicrobiales bacterium]HOL61809.1 iron ABC transporter permease [Elusimicrobiales bacterium]HPO94609.1 iron ABC transporter permease [Elusimicrobiales bacterium]